ncbi:MAG: ABC transporter permease [Paludibacteraceae bacterium]|nr:ABC transporter permease [Paludibacteraceae bacterium]
MNLVWKILKQHISKPQFAGFFLANLVGMLIILLGIQIYNDATKVFDGKEGFMKEDYLIISKKVSTLGNTIFKQSTSFRDDELAQLEEQEFVEKVGVFTPSNYKVRAGLNLMGFSQMSTDMFFESVPDEFVDTDKKWGFKEGDRFIPIILPRDYLDLYNFGFAQSKNLPTISEGLATSVTLDITIRGNGKEDHYDGRIVGFTNRLNTLLVPQAFMEWANKTYAPGKKVEKSRTILKVGNPADQNLVKYLQNHNYQTDNSKLKASKTAYILRLCLVVVTAVGVVICLLAFYILMLSIYLLIQKNSNKLEDLMLLGYSPAEVARPYQTLSIVLNAAVLLLAIIAVLFIRNAYTGKLEAFFPNYEGAGLTTTLLVGVGLFVLVAVFNHILVAHKMKSIWNRKD